MDKTRINALDGLRGFAAVAVLFSHLLTSDPWFSNAQDSVIKIKGNLIQEALFYSPLHIFFAGHEAVVIFFVLSGVVLSRNYSYRESKTLSYLLPRLARLYLPILGALVFAFLTTLLWPTSSVDNLSSAQSRHLEAVRLTEIPTHLDKVLFEFLLLPGAQKVNSPLWTMTIEIAASIFLFVIIAISRLRFLGILLTLIFAYLSKPIAGIEWFTTYLPFFIAGSFIASQNLKPLKRYANELFLVSIVSFSIPWLSPWFGIELMDGPIAKVSLFIGAVTIVLAVMSGSNVELILNSKAGQYLGSRSYSLYLVHSPILIAVGFLVRANYSDVNIWFWYVLPTVVLVFGVTELFYRMVEKPSQHIAKSLKARMVRVPMPIQS